MSALAITGASSGIGQAIAEVYARKGHDLFLGARRLDKLKALEGKLIALGANSVYFQELDVRSNDEVTAWTEAAFKTYPKLEILVNNAGLVLGTDTIETGSIEDWATVFDTNVMGVLRLCRQFIPKFKAQARGHIVMIGSISGHQVYEGGGPYCASKFSVKALTATLKLELNGSGVRVSSIDPGMVETEFSEVRFKGDAQRAKLVYQSIIPLQAVDVAEAVEFVTSRPQHVNIDDIIIMPTDQASVSKMNRRT